MKILTHSQKNRARLDRLRLMRERAGFTIEQAAARLGISHSQVSRFEREVSGMPVSRLWDLASLYGCTPGDLIEDRDERFDLLLRQPIRMVPVIDYAQAGSWRMIADAYEPGDGHTFIAADRDVGPRCFALDIVGDSMTPEFAEGDRVIIDPDVPPSPGDFIVAKQEEENAATFKKYRPRSSHFHRLMSFELVPLNPDWPVITVSSENPGSIVGTMIEHHRYRRR